MLYVSLSHSYFFFLLCIARRHEAEDAALLGTQLLEMAALVYSEQEVDKLVPIMLEVAVLYMLAHPINGFYLLLARKYLERVLVITKETDLSTHAVALYQYGKFHMIDPCDYEVAIRCFTRAYDINPTHHHLISLAQIYTEQRRYPSVYYMGRSYCLCCVVFSCPLLFIFQFWLMF